MILEEIATFPASRLELLALSNKVCLFDLDLVLIFGKLIVDGNNLRLTILLDTLLQLF